MVDNKIRNFTTLPTGDAMRFEALIDGVWRRAKLTGTAGQILVNFQEAAGVDVPPHFPERLHACAAAKAAHTATGEEIVVTSDDVQ